MHTLVTPHGTMVSREGVILGWVTLRLNGQYGFSISGGTESKQTLFQSHSAALDALTKELSLRHG